MELTAEAVRVLGCLAEKERTVPDTYPLTLKALVTACNQSSNRWPVVQYDAGTVQRTLDDLKADGFVRFVHPSHGERSTKFRHVLGERLGLEPAEVAVLALLFLRGPQTAAELRSRTDRLHTFGSTGEVEDALRTLASRDEPLVRLLDRRPGEREARWLHLLAPPPTDTAPAPAPAPSSRFERGPDVPGVPDARRTEIDERVRTLEVQVAHLYQLLGESPPTV
jgi:uncharacterized protein YceH (UPF0502 family)